MIPKVPRTVYLPTGDFVKRVDMRKMLLGYKSFNEYVLHLIGEDLDKASADGSIKEEKALTPQDQITKLGEDIGRIRNSLAQKYFVLRYIVTHELGNGAPKDLRVATDQMWEWIADRYCYVQFDKKFGGKPFAFERKDVNLFLEQAIKKQQIRELKAQLKKES